VDGVRGEPLIGANYPAWDEDHIGTGSTDVGDVSWITPLSMLNTACFATGAAGHSWGVVATGRTSIGHKGMMHAAKIMAVAAMDLWLDPAHLQKARKEFERQTKDRPYSTPLPEGTLPPTHPNPVRGVD
jgi:aminobenzoyl-glutamate utilization protein B